MDKKAILKLAKDTIQSYSYRSKNEEGQAYFDGDDLELPGLTVTQEDAEGGGEGEGEHVHIVFKVSDGNNSMFIMATGFYSSYDGTDWSYGEVSEVEPFQKTIRDWKSVS